MSVCGYGFRSGCKCKWMCGCLDVCVSDGVSLRAGWGVYLSLCARMCASVRE